MKKTSTLILRNTLLFFAAAFLAANFRAGAQTATPQAASAQSQSAAALSTTAKPVARITQAINEAQLVTIHRSVHPLVRTAFDQGVVADSLALNRMLLVLQRSPEQESALSTLMDGQQTKNSPNYHAWLTPAQFGQQFGVADADIQKIADWLSQKGFTGSKATGPGKMFIEFSGTAGTVRTAFHTEMHNFLLNGEKHIANVSDPQIPAALAPVVARIHSLHDFQKKSYLHRSKALEQARADGKLKPAFGTGPAGNPPNIFAVGPGDLAKIYNIPATVAGSPAGTGQTIALVARGNIAISDINQFGAAFGLPALANFSTANVIVNGPDPGIVPGDSDEATVDVEMAGSAAPNATILLVVNQGTATGNLAGLSQPTDGVDQSALYIVENNLAAVMSQSFGACEADSDTLFSSVLWEQAAAQGITVVVSTGDSGADVCDADQGNVESTAASGGPSVSGSASTPFNVAVGGTDFDDASNPTTFWNNTAALETAKGYIPEITWNNGCAAGATAATLNTVCTSVDPGGLDLSGGSGGQSNCGVQNFNTNTCTGYPKPAWQSAPGVPTDGVRDIPDVSLFAAVNSPSNNFYVICDSATDFVPGQPCNLTGIGSPLNFSAFGGTSLSTPAFAGMIALVNQSELAAGRGGRQGNANYVLYKLATAQTASACNSSTGPAATCTFNDVTKGNNSVICDVGSPNCSNQTGTGFGVLVEPSTPNPPFSATTPAWTTTAGYDLATGLGSVNAANMIANWSSVTTNFKAATPAITNPASGAPAITHGSSQSFTIAVTSSSGGTPTGDVSLIAEPPGFGQVGVGSATLSGGTATISTNMLPGDNTTGAGTPYPVIAHYAGDGTFAPGDSAPVTVTVNRENSTTTETLFTEDIRTGALTATTSVQYGTNYIMIVNVVGATAGVVCNNTSAFNPNVPSSITQIPTVPCPTGTITLKDNGQPLNDFVQTGATRINNSTVGNLGFVEDLLIQLLGGSHPIVASYSGDNSYNPSASTGSAFTVTPAPTQSAVTLNGLAATTAAPGQSVTLVATVNTGYSQTCNVGGSGGLQQCQALSNGAGPTGTVTFSPCGTASSCTVPVVPTAFNSVNGGAFATATLTTSYAAGTQTINAAFTSGDLNYSSCTANGGSCALTPLVLTVSGTAVGAATKLAFTAQPSSVPAGIAISPVVQVAIEDATGKIVGSATNSVTIAIGANPSSGTLGGTVTAAAVSGIATFSNLSINTAGPGYTLTAAATGLTSTTSAAFNVTAPAAKLVFVVQPSNTNAGASIIPAMQVAIEDASGNIVTSATSPVTIAIGANPSAGTLAGTATVVPVSGIATFPNMSINAGGTGYTLTASASGLTGATSSTFNVLVAAAKLAFIVEPTNATAGISIAPAVRVAIEDANGNVIPGATNPIAISIGTNPATGTLAGATTGSPAIGIATFSNLNINNAGTGYTLTATAAGLTSATSTAFNVTAPVTPSFTLSSTPLVLNSGTGAAAASTITVTSTNGFNSPVTINLPTSLPAGVTCTAPAAITPPANGTATGQLMCSVVATSTTLTASNAQEDGMFEAKIVSPASAAPSTAGGKGWWTFSAGTGFAALFLIFLPGGRKKYRAALGLGLGCILSLTIGCSSGGSSTPPPPMQTATVTKLTVPSGKVASGTPFTFSVAVTGGTPAGMVQLFDGATMIGTAATVASGAATPVAPALSVGTHSISAHYLGDSTTLASASGTLNLTVTGPTTIAITTSPVATPAAPAITVTVN